MPDTYQPSDEQIGALADQIADYSGDERCPGAFDPYERAARTYTAWPAFQSIIRAAQAEAWHAAITHAWMLSDRGATVDDVMNRLVLVDTDIRQALDENPHESADV